MSAVAEQVTFYRPRPMLPIHRFSVEQYHRMIELGVLTANDKVELLEGWIVDKMPQHPSHGGTTSVLGRKLRGAIPKSWIVREQSPITLELSEPEPDITVARGPEERYFAAHPTPEEIAMLAEVSDTTLEYDRTINGPLYAEAGIPYYWIVNLAEFKVEVYSQPKIGKAPKFKKRQDYGLQFGVPIVIENRERGGIAVAHLFPHY
jgi:Uma2 family endonuclease